MFLQVPIYSPAIKTIEKLLNLKELVLIVSENDYPS